MSQSPEKRHAQRTKWETQLKADRSALMAQPAFRRVMIDSLDQTGVFRLSYTGEATHATAFNEGRRNEGLRVLEELLAAEPNAYALLQAARMPEGAAPPDEDTPNE